ncbi:MAG: tetratricopeptide repeat protein [Candidatus Hodarchaeota archaeon]
MENHITYLEPKELILVKQLIDKGKSEKAIQLMNKFEETGERNLHEIVSCHLLKCELLFQQGQYEDLVKFTEQTYGESLVLGKHLLSIDALCFKALGLVFLYRKEEVSDTIKQAEKLLKTLTKELPKDYKKRKARIIYVKAFSNNKYFNRNGDVNFVLDQLYQSLALQEEVGDKEEIAISLMEIIYNLGRIKGETNDALKYIERFLALVKKKELKNKYIIAFGLTYIYAVYFLRGELDLSIKYYEQSLAIFKELYNKSEIAVGCCSLGNTYRMKGEYNRALDYAERGLALYSELEMLKDSAKARGVLIQILIDKGDLESAQKHLDQIERLNNQLRDEYVNMMHLYYKALILKASPRAKNRVQAEEILKELLDEGNIYSAAPMLELCDLLLVELRITNDLEVLEEIESIIARLLDESERMNSYFLLAETYFLKAKLALLTLDLIKARYFLTKAQEIAEKYGLNRLAIKISNEHDELLKRLDEWNKIKESESSLSERMKLAHLNEQMERMIRKQEIDVPELTDEEPIVLLIISEGGRPVFSESFAEEWAFEDHLFGGFLTAINSFSDQMFSEGLNRANFGEYTIIMNSLHPFLVCYLFKGQSYLAQQRVAQFIDKVKEDAEIWNIFNKFNQASRLVQLKDIPSLKPLINEIFIDKSVPLIA